ncbi:MAG: SDR family oxidoreductase [Pirellula sp.]|jgi:NAD(P)-dependent dehydrogenase (short-subunit alcohol dehydrogenase family)|nr:SDR family oxidoreductase [Pirellula sp.]
MEINLKGHTAVVTGGTQGVGAAIAVCLARAGANIVLHGLNEDHHALETSQSCRSHGVEVRNIYFDLFNPIQDVMAAFRKVCLQSESPAPTLLVNNAGIFIDHPFLDMDEETFHRTFQVNVTVGYFLTQLLARHWVQNGVEGRVLFTGSINGLLAEPNHSAYDASKAAVAGMVRSLCVALAPNRIRINSMAPGLVRTPLTNQVLAQDPESLAWMQLHTPNGQVPGADVCGPMAAFLLSDLASHIHGQTMYVDGGMSIWQQPDLPNSLRTAR